MSLAKLAGAELHAVNVVHPSATVGFADSRSGQDQVNTKREEAEKIRSQLLADAEAEGVSVRSTIQAGKRRRRFLARQTSCLGTLSWSATEVWTA